MSMGSARQKGFTLLELLIGMVLLGMMLTLLFGGLRLGSRSWDSGDRSADASAQLRAVHGFMRRELGQAFPLRWKNEADTRLAFEGAADALKFVAPLPAHASAGGLYLLGLKLEYGENGQRLVLRRMLAKPETRDFSALDEGDPSVLAEQVKSLSIAYFGAATADGEPAWQNEWHDPQRLPLLVRIQVEFDADPDWPELVASLMVEGCPTWDSFHKRCINIY